MPLNNTMEAFWSQIGDTSYGIYLAHPFWLLIMTGIMAKYNLLFTVPHVVLLYVMAVGLSYLTTVGLKQIPKPIRKYILGN